MRKLLIAIFSIWTTHAAAVSPEASSVADYAADRYPEAMVTSLAKMVSYNTVALDNVAFEETPAMNEFKSYLKSLSKKLGLDFADHGYVMLIGLGDSPTKLGVITHGDVQPADANKWQQKFITRDQFIPNLKMYTAVFVELGKAP